MSFVSGLSCVRCGKAHPARAPNKPLLYVCPDCGGNLQVTYDYAAMKKVVTRTALAVDESPYIWRFSAMLPVDAGARASRLQVGGTPLMPAPALGAQLGLSKLWIKDDSRNPSASFKDRAGAVALAVAYEQGAKLVAGASTGNAASSFALLTARTGMPALIFVPENAPAAKVAQILLFGAQVVAVRGTYDHAFDLCLEACQEFGWYNRNTGFNPYTREGKKTCAYEIIEQLEWEVPDWVFVSVGDGNIISGLWKGFTDLKALGLISKLPRLAAVQASGSNSVKLAFEGDGKIRPVSGDTIADSISVSVPRDGEAAVKALRESNGIAIAVGDEEILAGMRLAARHEGVFAEPAAAATVAGAARAVVEGRIRKNDSVVAVITGSGLKDVPSAQRAAGKPHVIAPTMAALKELLKERVRL